MPNPLASPRGGGGPLEIVARDSRGETMSYIMRIIHLPRRAQRAEPCVHAAKHTETKGNAVESHGKTSGKRPERPVGKVGNGRCLSLTGAQLWSESSVALARSACQSRVRACVVAVTLRAVRAVCCERSEVKAILGITAALPLPVVGVPIGTEQLGRRSGDKRKSPGYSRVRTRVCTAHTS